MCRVLSYLGVPIVVEELLYNPDNSFIKQSYDPMHMSHMLNLAGLGLVAWDPASYNPAEPFFYKTSQLPFHDTNLRSLASKIAPNCFLSHIRGVPFSEHKVVSIQNVHPFMFDNSNIALAHNGELFDFDVMKFDLLEFIKPEYRKRIRGTTDSEWIYALFLSQLHAAKGNFYADEIIDAVIETLRIIGHLRRKYNLITNSPVNLFITNGEFIAATRFVFDYGWHPFDAEPSTHFTYHSLWYTYGEAYGEYAGEYQMKPGGKRSSIIIASEPLTQDTTTWVEVPEYTLIFSRVKNGEVEIVSRDINI